MPAKLLIVSDIDKTQQEIPFDKPSITIGRRSGNDLHYNRPEISGNHAAFLMEGGQYWIQDLGSTNGTLLNGAPLIAKEKYPLQDQDLVTIAPYRITFLASRELSSTMLEGSMMKEIKSAAARPDFEPIDKIATGTAQHEIPDFARGGGSTGTDPDIQPTMSNKPAEPEPPPPPPPAPEPEPAAPPEPPPQPKPAARSAEPAAASAPEVPGAAEGPSSLPDFIWLAIGAVALLAAIGIIVLIFMF